MDRTIFMQGGCDLRGVRAMERVMQRIKPRTALDIGANRGNHAAFMRRHCDRLVCFEPNPVEYGRLSRLFEGDPGTILLNVALSDRSGEMPFLIYEVESGNSTLEVAPSDANARVQVETGDAIAGLHGLNDIDFIKLDVEGHEKAAFLGLSGVINKQRPFVVFEILEAQNSLAGCRIEVPFSGGFR
jgi:FkbM family methyltransferase